MALGIGSYCSSTLKEREKKNIYTNIHLTIGYNTYDWKLICYCISLEHNKKIKAENRSFILNIVHQSISFSESSLRKLEKEHFTEILHNK